MTRNDAIINPKKSRSSPELGPVAAMVATEADLSLLCELFSFTENSFRKLFISRLYVGEKSRLPVSLTGPLIGAPYAVMLLETLIAWGVRKILFLGWCGAISDNVKIGDVILPTAAMIDEGTSAHYISNSSASTASQMIVNHVRQYLRDEQIAFHHGTIWSTDAVYRETPAKIEYFQKQNALAVDMETSSLFTVAKFRGVELGSVLVVSDELSALKWRPGFEEKRFQQSRRIACRMVTRLCQRLVNQN
ncbi:MAG: nucleoside phosphorylase [Desulfobacterales bacterium]